MSYTFGGHQPGHKGKHPGSPSGPAMRGSGAYHEGLHYLPHGMAPQDIEDTNRVKGAHLEFPESQKAVDRAEGHPTTGRPTPRGPVVKGYAKGGRVKRS